MKRFLRSMVFWGTALLICTACKAGRDNPAAQPGYSPAAGKAAASGLAGAAGRSNGPARASLRPHRSDLACPECGGTGACPTCGDGRACLACDGDGICPICHGTGREDGRICPVCGGSGVCPVCQGDGIVSRATGDIGPKGAPFPGECQTCLFGTGLCPECGGSGKRPDGRVCAFCGGSGRCPDCRGDGLDPWCAGNGQCASCRGHGKVVDGRPGKGWPPIRLLLTNGTTVTGKLIDRPGETISIERSDGPKQVRESIVRSHVDPASVILSYRRYLEAPDPVRHRDIAKLALDYGDDFLFLAKREIDLAAQDGQGGGKTASLLNMVRNRSHSMLLRAAGRALGKSHDPRRAWVLFEMASNVRGGNDPDAARGAAEALADLRREDAVPTAALIKEKLSPDEDRLQQDVRRSRAWLVRAEHILSRTDAPVADLLRARFAARRALFSALRAMNRAPPKVDVALARKVADAARTMDVRAIVAIAARLLGNGLVERARALSVLALARGPKDEGARRFAASVEEVMGKVRKKPR